MLLRSDLADNGLLFPVLLSVLIILHLMVYRKFRRDQRRLEHIHRVLLGVRNINQLLVSEDDPLRLIEQACTTLTETIGYSGAWIALLDKRDQTVLATAASGSDGDFAPLRARLDAGEYPQCMARALESPGVVVTCDPQTQCVTCAYAPQAGPDPKLSHRLDHEGSTYGILTVSIPAAYARDEEELALFGEVAGDVGFALHKIDAAKRLRESAQAYSMLFNHSVAAIYLHDLEGRILDANQLASAQSGYSRDELLQMSIFDLHPDTPDSLILPRDEIVREWRTWQPEQSYTFAREHRRKDGRSYPVEISTGVIRYDGGHCIQAIVQDITERRQIERDLVHSRDLLRYIIEHDRSAIAVHDRDLNYVYVSQRYLDDYRIKDRDVVGKHYYEVLPDLPQKWKAVHQRALQGEVISAEEDPFKREDGRVDWTRWECRPWYEADGTIGGIIVYTEIVNERREMEEYLRRQERLAALGQLAAGISHDFRNLMATIIICGQLGKRAPDLHPQAAHYLDIIVEEAQKSTDLIGQILDFGRNTELELRPLDLVAFVEKIAGVLRRTIPSTIIITVEAEPGACMIEGDAGRLQQVLTNLALNARDAMPDGGTLRIGVSRIPVEPGAAPPLPAMAEAPPPPAWICLSVADTGTGMTQEAVAHLFEPFFTTKGEGKGSGLGLAQVYGIVNLHKGYVDVENVPGQGVTVRTYLPEVPDRPDPPEAAVVSSTTPSIAPPHRP